LYPGDDTALTKESHMTREIAPKNWERFCRQISENHRGSSVSIEVMGEQAKTIAWEVPLQNLLWEPKNDACSDMLTIETGPGSSRYQITEPIHLILRKSGGEERFHLLEIPAESGTVTITFHPGITMEQVEEICREDPASTK
jgi:hypothetical protein